LAEIDLVLVVVIGGRDSVHFLVGAR
jgi:hypothetical protein